MSSFATPIADSLNFFEQIGEPVPVSLSNEIIQLLSEQLYQSPLKAIEELVVNSYDADAQECRIYVPAPTESSIDFVVVYDNGIGMTRDGLVDLWQIGRSNKRTDEITRRSKRKQIGKFGIGKLATYTIAHRLTYLTKSEGQILSVTVDFNNFSKSATGSGKLIELPVRVISDIDDFVSKTYLIMVLRAAGVSLEELKTQDNWTIAILEGLKEKARKITLGELQWVLSTAMPLKIDFRLFLNCEEIVSSKENIPKIVSFDLKDLSRDRIESLKKSTGEEWQVVESKLVSDSFRSGIAGDVLITEKTLLGKSDDIARSHGFFIRVRDRLVNEDDPLFGMTPLVHGAFNRFRADIQADDLDAELKASRETLEESRLKIVFRAFLREVFNEANKKYEEHQKKAEGQDANKREDDRNNVPARLVEFPMADALLAQVGKTRGTEADETWFYIRVSEGADLKLLAQSLYASPRSKYRYDYAQNGASSRIVAFDPSTHTFWINEDHELVREYRNEGRSRILLEDMVTAEAMLEVYLRESAVSPHIIGAVLERRDALLRSLAKDHTYSLESISKNLIDSASNERALEVSLVVAARALGFVASHISGAGEPDGIARFIDYPNGEKKITLEAKSSDKMPQLGAIDFAGLREHVQRHSADGCLLVAPGYPGGTREEDSAAAMRATEQRISCWTVEQLARFIVAAEQRHLNAQHVLDIVLNSYSPEQVTGAIDRLLATSSKDETALYRAILKALRQLEGRLKDRSRTVDMISTQVSNDSAFAAVDDSAIDVAIRDLASASQGGMTIRGDRIVYIHVSYDELDRRLSGLTKQSGDPRGISGFRQI